MIFALIWIAKLDLMTFTFYMDCKVGPDDLYLLHVMHHSTWHMRNCK